MLTRKTRLFFGAVVLVPKLLASAATGQEVELHRLEGRDVPPYILAATFLSHVQSLAEDDGPRSEELARFLGECGLSTDDHRLVELTLRAAGQQKDMYRELPASLQPSPSESIETQRERSLYIVRGIGRIFGELLGGLEKRGVVPTDFEANLREVFVNGMGLALSTDDPQQAIALEADFRDALNRSKEGLN